MALNFPNNPGIGSIFTDPASGFSYKWNGTSWTSYALANAGNILILDNISGGFNGSTTSFSLKSNGTDVFPASPAQLVITLNKLVQSPQIDYTVSSSNIIFTTAPGIGTVFSGVSLGPAVPINTIGIQSNSSSVSSQVSTINFQGVGNTFSVSGNTVNVKLRTGDIGNPVGDKDLLFSWVAAAATVTQSITFDTTNSGPGDSYIFSIIPTITIPTGIAVTVGVGKTLVIDALQVGDI